MRKRIEICGGIASGKTTLAREIEKEGVIGIYEKFQDNPFLEDFYLLNNVDISFEAEVAFLLLHFNAIKTIESDNIFVCDYSLEQDYCYGINNLKKTDKRIFKEVYKYLYSQVSCADLIIYLKCAVECMYNRIRSRNRALERAISYKYLKSNVNTLEKFLKSQKNRHILVIESDKYDFSGGKDRLTVINQIMTKINSI